MTADPRNSGDVLQAVTIALASPYAAFERL
jgi:hypothetical protein